MLLGLTSYFHKAKFMCILFYFGPIRTSRKFDYLDKIFVINNVLQLQMVCRDLTKFLRKKLQTHRRQNLSRVKTGQNRLKKQSFVHLVVNMS